MSVVQETIGGVRWADLDPETISAMSPLKARNISVALLAGLKRSSIVSKPTASRPFGGPEQAVWSVYHSLRARGNAAPVEFVPVEPEPEPKPRPKRARRRSK